MNIVQEYSSISSPAGPKECYKVTQPNTLLKVIVGELMSRANDGDTTALEVLNKAFERSDN